jgi:hypothetical protein
VASQVFFEDLFAHLTGERPRSSAARGKSNPTDAAGSAGGTSRRKADAAWPEIVSAATLEDEIKAIKIRVDRHVSTARGFAARDQAIVRDEFAILATLFAVIHEYDGDVRWQEEAAVARDRFASAVSSLQAESNPAAFAVAKQRKLDLQDLVGGGTLADAAAERSTDWPEACQRAPLMKRLERGLSDILVPRTVSRDEFTANGGPILHEAEMTAALGEVLLRPGMDDAEDEEYVVLAERMEQAALAVSEAVNREDYKRARAEVSAIGQACTDCHDMYR